MSDLSLTTIGHLLDKKISKAFAPIKQTLTQHTASLISIENKLGVYGDMYKINKDHIKRLDKRVTSIENHLGIQNPVELNIPD